MNLLLDAHAFLWFVGEDEALSSKAKELIKDANNEVFLSAANVWELAIKVSTGKLALVKSFEEFISEHLATNGITLLHITVAHAAAVVTLPFHHKDPFDRLLIAQSLVEQIPVISRDQVFDAYSIQRIC